MKAVGVMLGGAAYTGPQGATNHFIEVECNRRWTSIWPKPAQVTHTTCPNAQSCTNSACRGAFTFIWHFTIAMADQIAGLCTAWGANYILLLSGCLFDSDVSRPSRALIPALFSVCRVLQSKGALGEGKGDGAGEETPQPPPRQCGAAALRALPPPKQLTRESRGVQQRSKRRRRPQACAQPQSVAACMPGSLSAQRMCPQRRPLLGPSSRQSAANPRFHSSSQRIRPRNSARG